MLFLPPSSPFSTGIIGDRVGGRVGGGVGVGDNIIIIIGVAGAARPAGAVGGYRPIVIGDVAHDISEGSVEHGILGVAWPLG